MGLFCCTEQFSLRVIYGFRSIFRTDENGYIYKWEQNAKSELYFNIDGKKKRLRLKVNLDCKGLEYYPYLDTFKFYNQFESQFTNTDMYGFDYILTSSKGYLPGSQDEDDEDLDLSFDFDNDVFL